VFGGNDRPGIMLAAAMRAYANRFAVAPGRRVAIFTNNNDGWRSAADLLAAEIEVACIIDSREALPPDLTSDFAATRIIAGGQVVGTKGGRALRGGSLCARHSGSKPLRRMRSACQAGGIPT